MEIHDYDEMAYPAIYSRGIGALGETWREVDTRMQDNQSCFGMIILQSTKGSQPWLVISANEGAYRYDLIQLGHSLLPWSGVPRLLCMFRTRINTQTSCRDRFDIDRGGRWDGILLPQFVSAGRRSGGYLRRRGGHCGGSGVLMHG